ncbi:MAG: hypothetical protein JZD40_05525 [Sulfolobus sp.]|nr:hypothetical protein [Sulfolobus sp.]
MIDIDTRKIVSFYITSGRSGVDAYKIINQLGKDILFIHDKGSWYNMLDWQKVPNKHEKFGIRNV